MSGTSMTTVADGGVLIPALLDFQPIILHLQLGSPLLPQLNAFCSAHGIDRRRCPGLANAMAALMDWDRQCANAAVNGDTVPAFVHVKNILLPSGDPTVSRVLAPVRFQWTQDSTSNIASDMCAFLTQNDKLTTHADAATSTTSACARSLQAAFDRTFGWLQSLPSCSHSEDDKAVPVEMKDEEPERAVSVVEPTDEHDKPQVEGRQAEGTPPSVGDGACETSDRSKCPSDTLERTDSSSATEDANPESELHGSYDDMTHVQGTVTEEAAAGDDVTMATKEMAASAEVALDDDIIAERHTTVSDELAIKEGHGGVISKEECVENLSEGLAISQELGAVDHDVSGEVSVENHDNFDDSEMLLATPETHMAVVDSSEPDVSSRRVIDEPNASSGCPDAVDSAAATVPVTAPASDWSRVNACSVSDPSSSMVAMTSPRDEVNSSTTHTTENDAANTDDPATSKANSRRARPDPSLVLSRINQSRPSQDDNDTSLTSSSETWEVLGIFSLLVLAFYLALDVSAIGIAHAKEVGIEWRHKVHSVALQSWSRIKDHLHGPIHHTSTPGPPPKVHLSPRKKLAMSRPAIAHPLCEASRLLDPQAFSRNHNLLNKLAARRAGRTRRHAFAQWKSATGRTRHEPSARLATVEQPMRKLSRCTSSSFQNLARLAEGDQVRRQLSFSCLAMALTLGKHGSHYHKIAGISMFREPEIKFWSCVDEVMRQRRHEDPRDAAASVIQKCWKGYRRVRRLNGRVLKETKISRPSTRLDPELRERAASIRRNSLPKAEMPTNAA